MSEARPKVGDRIRAISPVFAFAGIEGTVCKVDALPGFNDFYREGRFEVNWDLGRSPTGCQSPSSDAWHWGFAGLPEQRFELLPPVFDEWDGNLELL